jgi:RNA polymerase primary sigma factor
LFYMNSREFVADYTYAPQRSESFYDDVTQAYLAGVVGSEALFDPYPDEDADLPEPSFGAQTIWDEAHEVIIGQVCQDSRFLDKSETTELINIAQSSKQVPEGLPRKSNPSVEALSDTERLDLQQGNMAEERLIDTNLRFITWFVRESMGFHSSSNQATGRKPHEARYGAGKIEDYRRLPMDYADRLQVASMGFMKAVKNHDPEKGNLRALALHHMEAALLRGVQEASAQYVLRFPVHVQDDISKLRRSVRSAISEGRLPNLDEVVYETGLQAERVKELGEWVAMYGSQISLNALVESTDAYRREIAVDGDDECITVADTIRVQNDLEPFVELEDYSVYDALYNAIGELTERQHDALAQRFGLYDEQPRTLEEVGEWFGVTRETARQIEAGAVAALRHPRIGYLHGDLLVDNLDIHTGMRDGTIPLSAYEIARLQLLQETVYDETPSDKYAMGGKPKFNYVEDWAN